MDKLDNASTNLRFAGGSTQGGSCVLEDSTRMDQDSLERIHRLVRMERTFG